MLALFFLLVLALAPARPASASEDLPTLVVESPRELLSIADRLRTLDRRMFEPGMRITGLSDPGPPVRVVLAAERSELARAVPAWVSGYADGAKGIVVLLPSRVPRYPDADLETLVQHEVAHVLVSRATGGRRVPRWFNEGVAMAASRRWDVPERTLAAFEVLTHGRVPLSEIDAVFAGGRGDVASAYRLSRAFVHDLMRRHGKETPGRILAGVAAGESFDSAFESAVGRSLASVEASFWRRQTFWNRWVPILGSSVTLWVAITFLALAAFRRRRVRDLEQYARWEEEEQWLEASRMGGDDEVVN